MIYQDRFKEGFALLASLVIFLQLPLGSRCRSMPTNLLFVDDSLDIYDNGLRIAHYELWPFPFIEAVSLSATSNLLLFSSIEDARAPTTVVKTESKFL